MSFKELLEKTITSEDDYLSYVKAAFDDWKNKNYSSAEELAKYIENLNTKSEPHFFYGRLDSDFVILALNPHSDEKKPGSEVKGEAGNWDEYLKLATDFNKERYLSSGSLYKKVPSHFDKKCLSFLNKQSYSNDDEVNAKLAESHNLQIELCPFSSPSFSVKKDANKKELDAILEKYLLRTLEVINIHKRKWVLVLNSQTCNILDKLSKHNKEGFSIQKESSEQFFLTKKDGKETKKKAKKIVYKVSVNGSEAFKIIAAPTFANQSIGNALAADYGKHFSEI